MGYANRGELKTAVRSWLTEQSTTVLPDSDIEDAIGFVEDDLNWGTWGPQQRTFRVFEMQAVKTTSAFAQDEEYISLPDGFISMRYVIQTDASLPQTLTYAEPKDFAQIRDDSGPPEVYTFSNQRLRIRPSLPQGSTIEMGYYEQIPALEDDSASNWLLEKAPKIYLSGTLAHLAVFLQGESQQDRYEANYLSTVTAMIVQNMRRRTGEAPLTLGQHEAVA